MKNTKNIIITIILLINLIVFLYFKEYIYIIYNLNNNRISNFDNSYELKNTNFIISYLESSKDSKDDYLKKTLKLSSVLSFFSVKISIDDILKINNDSSYSILCVDNKKSEDYINLYCNSELYFRQEKNINENFDCKIFTESKISKKCEDKKNQILNDNSFNYCSNIDCKINNIIYWTYRDNSPINKKCSILKDEIFINKCKWRYDRFVLFLKNLNTINNYDKILNNNNLNDIEAIVYKNIYSWYDTIPENNCLQLKNIDKIKKCEVLYKEILDYIDNQKEQIMFKKIKQKLDEKIN